MNTDNMIISGETIDYGACAFIDTYDPDTVFSSIDKDSRYSFKNQPSIGHWNLIRFVETLLPMLATDGDLSIQIAEKELAKYEYEFQKAYDLGMKKKLGFLCKDDNSEILIQNLFQLMYKNKADYANTFIRLTLEVADEKDGSYLEGTEKLFKDVLFKKWKENIKLSKENKEDIYNAMKKQILL